MSDPYRPGQYPAGPDQTTRIPPVRSHGGPPHGPRPPAPTGQPSPDRTKQWVLRGLGLLLVAVVSGMLWWLVQQGGGSSATDDPGTTTGAKPAGKYTFTKAAELPDTVRDSNCEEHSYGKTQKFFKEHKCVGLSRQLYTADVDGRKAYASVSVVQMADGQDAQDLKTLTGQDQTGNVTDLVKDNGVKIAGGPKVLTGGGFAASVSGKTVVIVEADFAGTKKPSDGDLLDEVCKDALRMGDEVSHSG